MTYIKPILNLSKFYPYVNLIWPEWKFSLYFSLHACLSPFTVIIIAYVQGNEV